MGVNLHNFKLNYSFLDITLKVRTRNERINKLHVIQIFKKSW